MTTVNKYFTEIDILQGSPEWKLLRLDYVTASEIPVIMGVSPYKTALQLGEAKISRHSEESSTPNYVFAKGHAVEKAAREYVKANFNEEFPPLVAVSKRLPFIMASLDGFSTHHNKVFEVKLANQERFKAAKNGQIPPDHMYQIQTQMLVTGAKACVYFTSNLDGESIAMEIPADLNMHKAIESCAKRFWDNLKKGVLPEPTDKDIYRVEDIRFQELKNKMIALKQIEEEVERIKLDLKSSYDFKIVTAYGLTMKKTTAKGTVSYGDIPELQGVDLEKYRKPAITKVYFQIDKE